MIVLFRAWCQAVTSPTSTGAGRGLATPVCASTGTCTRRDCLPLLGTGVDCLVDGPYAKDRGAGRFRGHPRLPPRSGASPLLRDPAVNGGMDDEKASHGRGEA